MPATWPVATEIRRFCAVSDTERAWNVPGSIENANAVPFSGGLNGVLLTAAATPVIGSTT